MLTVIVTQWHMSRSISKAASMVDALAPGGDSADQMNRPLTYWHCGGDLVCARGLVLSQDDAAALRGLYLDEAEAAGVAGDRHSRATALRLAWELSTAAAAASRWRQAAFPSVR
jgi:hypothetical protein